MTLVETPSKEGEFKLDFESPEFLNDPYPTYHALREHNPIYRSAWDDWYLTRYADVARVLTDKSFLREPPSSGNARATEVHRPSPVEQMLGQWMLFVDPPKHTRLRRVLSQSFTTKMVQDLQPQVKTIANSLLDHAANQSSFDLVAELSFPLPVIVVSRILGVPPQDYELFRSWSVALTNAIDSSFDHDSQLSIEATIELLAYMKDLISARRVRPKDDLISRVASPAHQQDFASDDELAANLVMLLWAGHETTKNLISNGVLALLRNPGQYLLLTENQAMLSGAVEEFLRFDSPVQKTARWTTEPTSIGGRVIPANQCVVTMLGAANRDPEVFSEPDKLDIARKDSSNLAFGRGIHHCLGFAVARMEAEIAIAALLQRTSEIELATNDIEWQKTTALRGPVHLQLKVRWR